MSLTAARGPFGEDSAGRFNFEPQAPTGAVLYWDPVAYRLRGIEDLLGYPVSTRSLELRIALRLAALLKNDTPEP